jgi:hypothetical protein
VQSVPAPPLVGRAPRRAPAIIALAVLLAAAAVAVAVATRAPDAPRPVAHPYNGLIGGVPLQQARCVQWNAGTAAEREKVVGALAYSVGGATTSQGVGTTLDSAQAHALFDNACSGQIAQHWLLYELYIRAAGFRSYVPQT